jgi:hypothetical protein
LGQPVQRQAAHGSGRTGFAVIITADQNFCYQQNLKDRRIAIVALGTNLWPVIKPRASEVAMLVDAAQPGEYYFLDFPAAHKRKQTQRPMPDSRQSQE